jgi:NAD(P)-dependent dehydrogenase (short-subunit alcohol dehydrogenase family)
MGISFVDKWLKRNGARPAVAVPETMADDQEGITELLSECDLLRDQAAASGVELDDSADSLAALDQLMPRWRDDPQRMDWLGNDAGLYLGTVIVRTVRGATWRVTPDGRAVIQLASGREVDVVEAGHEWAEGGTPELARAHAEAAEGSG